MSILSLVTFVYTCTQMFQILLTHARTQARTHIHTHTYLLLLLLFLFWPTKSQKHTCTFTNNIIQKHTHTPTLLNIQAHSLLHNHTQHCTSLPSLAGTIKPIFFALSCSHVPILERNCSLSLNPTVADSINEVASQPKALHNTLITFVCLALPELAAVMPWLRLVGGWVPVVQS